MIYFARFGKSVSEQLVEPSLDGKWWNDNIKEKSVKQNNDEFRILAMKVYDTDFTAETVEPFLNEENGFDTTLENLKLDFARMKA